MIVRSCYRSDVERFAPDCKITVPDGGVPLRDPDGVTIGRLVEAVPDGEGGLLLTLDVDGDCPLTSATVDGLGLVYGPARPALEAIRRFGYPAS